MKLTKLIKQLKQNYNILPELERLYFDIGIYIREVNQELINHLSTVRDKKNEMKEDFKSIAEFNREFDLSTEGVILKSYKYQLSALEHLKSSCRVRIEGLKTEYRNPNY